MGFVGACSANILPSNHTPPPPLFLSCRNEWDAPEGYFWSNLSSVPEAFRNNSACVYVCARARACAVCAVCERQLFVERVGDDCGNNDTPFPSRLSIINYSPHPPPSLSTRPHPDRSYENYPPTGDSLLWMLALFFVYFLLAVWADVVAGGATGVRSYPWFFFLPSYWGCMKVKPRPPTSASERNDEVDPDVVAAEELVASGLDGNEYPLIFDKLEKRYGGPCSPVRDGCDGCDACDFFCALTEGVE